MLLFTGLGNPGARYASTRHNLGFVVVDEIARRHGCDPWRNRHHGSVSRGRLGRTDVLLLKPATFMNRSGVAVADALRFYKLKPDDVSVFYDEIDLAPGKVRVKTGGGAAGHNGVRSVESHIGNGFRRVRIGIGHPGDKNQVESHVLNDFYRSEMTIIGPVIDAVADCAPLLAAGDEAGFLNAVALATRLPAAGADPDPA
ncbi:MAG: aminoacyl-tRNA hydrolase [Proteobacteria bacterium]|nr:aminoacyl-tRNA hydrolase [Pseudomonadota bacterium]